ncbi:MAG: pilus assembly protein CpaE [Anaerolineales bacterium]
MISLSSAQKLKKAGLQWAPELNDYFAIPERGMDERVFVISDMLVTVEMLKGMQIVSFQGASEWALDYLVASEAVWLPREDQLRSALEALLLAVGRPEFHLSGGLEGYRCEISYHDEQVSFESAQAVEAYTAALLFILQSDSKPTRLAG